MRHHPTEPVLKTRGGAASNADRLNQTDVVVSCICLLLGFAFAARGITSSLWLDETATYWVVKDGLREVFSRVWQWTGASLPYDLMAWVARFLAPVLGIEAALRLPSLLCMAAAVALLYQIGRYLAGPRAGALGAIAFLCIQEVAFAAIDARPYALGLALLLASMLCFLKWLDTSSRGYAIAYVISSALLVYTHYLLALALVAQAVYGFRVIRKLAPLWLATAVLCLPLAGPVLDLYRTRQSHLFATGPHFLELLPAVAPPVLATVIFLWTLAFRPSATEGRRLPNLLMLVWLLFPPLFLFVLAATTDIRLFFPRYYLSSAPAAALLTGHALSRMRAATAAGAVLVTMFVMGYWYDLSPHGPQDWRGAMAALNSQARPGDAILVASGFVEGTAQDINHRDVLFAPQLVYPTQSIYRLPNEPDQRAIPLGSIAGKRIFLVALQRQMDYAYWLRGALPGYRAEPVGTFGAVMIVKFEK